MNVLTTPLTETPGHTFDTERSPADCPILITTWRWRWCCSCGSAGTWQTTSDALTYRGWRDHLKKVRARERSAQRNDLEAS